CGMLEGLGITFVYMVQAQLWLRYWVLGVSTSEPVELWWDIQPIAAGVFGAPVAFATIVVVSLLTRKINPVTDALVDDLRLPD
ncbi:MAG: cation acetate symporter, partial [Alcaligenaceae bacterium]